MMTDMIIII